MSSTINLTVGDTGVTISGTITQKQLGTLANLTGCSVTFSLLRVGSLTPVVNAAGAVLGTLDRVNSSVAVSYRLQAADVASAVSSAFIRWTFTLPDGGQIHAPGNPDDPTYVRINA